MILLCSAAYIDQDLANEVGLIPPCFLPVNNKRLFELQLDWLDSLRHRNMAEPIFLTIPESYSIEEADAYSLVKRDICIIRVPDGLSLGLSIYTALTTSVVAETIDKERSTELKILHGDTLFLGEIPTCSDFVFCHPNRGFYHRARVDFSADKPFYDSLSGDEFLVLSGFFAFSKMGRLLHFLETCSYNFINALSFYHNEIGLILSKTARWYDFGHLNSYFQSRSEITTERVFNKLKIENKVVEKSGDDLKKLSDEAHWFETLPLSLRLYTPAYLGKIELNNVFSGYSLEYLQWLPLSDLYIFGHLPLLTWKDIFEELFNIAHRFTKQASQCHVKSLDFDLTKKTFYRLQQLELELEVIVDEINRVEEKFGTPLKEILERTALLIAEQHTPVIALVHGDFCFSNILFDARSKYIKLIDPRGQDMVGNTTSFGDQYYDIAKLVHSLIGGYDHIIAGRYTISDRGIVIHFSDHQLKIIELFERYFEDKFRCDRSVILSMLIHLFASMLPLHNDRPDRQQAFLLNCYRLFYILEGK